MDLIQASNTPRLAPILEWRIEDGEPDQGSVTGRLTKDCVSVFRRLMKSLPKENITKGTFRRLERSCSSLILWESGHGVAKGRLDDVLGKSRTLSRSTLGLLVSISDTLMNRLPPLIDLKDKELAPHRALSAVTAEARTRMYEGYQDGPDFDDSDSDSSSVLLSSDWDEIAEDIWTDVQCLHDLNPLIKFPAPDLVRPSRETQQEPVEWQPYMAYTDRIKIRFPNADLSLVDRLARANLERFQKGKANRKKNQSAEIKCGEFHDSGIGTLLNTGSAYAETVMSYCQEGGESVKIPPLSKEAKQGEPFECVACGRKLVIANSSAWKKHLYLDLCPWICHDLNCNFETTLFQTREGWVDHLGLGHGLAPEWKSFACPMCHEATGDGKFIITRHLSSHMEEISLAALPARIEADDGTDSERGTVMSASTSVTITTLQKAHSQYSSDFVTSVKRVMNHYTASLRSPPDLSPTDSNAVIPSTEEFNGDLESVQQEKHSRLSAEFQVSDCINCGGAGHWATCPEPTQKVPAGLRVDDERKRGTGAHENQDNLFLHKTPEEAMQSRPKISEEERHLVDGVDPRYTPVTGRVSKALNNMPDYTCLDCVPPRTFTRNEHLKRHELSHKEAPYLCKLPGCGRRFHRKDLLGRHEQKHGPEKEEISRRGSSLELDLVGNSMPARLGPLAYTAPQREQSFPLLSTTFVSGSTSQSPTTHLGYPTQDQPPYLPYSKYDRLGKDSYGVGVPEDILAEIYDKSKADGVHGTQAKANPQQWLERVSHESETHPTGEWDERMRKVERQKFLEQWIQITRTGQVSTLQEPRSPSNEELERTRIEIPKQQQQHQDPAAKFQGSGAQK